MKSLFQVDGKPFFSIGGQTHNSSTCRKDAMDRAWRAVDALGLNTIAAPIYWSQVEPEEGTFCFDQVDWISQGAREHGVKAVILWFGTWKNGTSHYAPKWVKRDKARFAWCKSISGAGTRILSPLCKETLEADKRAFVRVMEYIKSINGDETIIAVQVENEPGQIGTPRDYSAQGNAEFAKPVPAELVDWLRGLDGCYLKECWTRHGAKEAGGWEALFGVDGAEVFSAYHVARYCNAVAAAGRAVYSIPLYVNVWLGEMYNRVAGVDFPSGGPTCHMIDLWKWLTPDVDLIAPDVYLQDYRTYAAVCDAYAREDNLLYIPESPSSLLNSLHIFDMIEKKGLTGIHSFGIDSVLDDDGLIRPNCVEFAHAVRILTAMRPLIERYHGTGRIHAVAQYEGATTINYDFGGFLGRVNCYSSAGTMFSEPVGFMDTHHTRKEDFAVRAKGMIIDAGEGVYYIGGEGFRLTFTRKDNIDHMASGVRASSFSNGRHGEYLSVEEGYIDERGEFVARRERCGDESDNGVWTQWDVGVIRVVMDL